MISKSGPSKTKTRVTRSRLVPAHANEQYNAAGTLIGTYTGNIPFYLAEKNESITYTTKIKSQRHLSNVCIQKVTSTTYPGSPEYMVMTKPSGAYDRYYGGHSTGDLYHATAIGAFEALVSSGSGQALLGARGQEFINEAAERLRPDLTTVSIPNFLLDIKDLKALFKLWKSNLSLAKNAAGAHLNYKFGWAPTYGDISAMVDVIRNMQAKLKAFEDSLGRVFTRSTTIFQDSFESSGHSLPQSNVDLWWNGSITRTVTAHFKWRPKPLAVMGGMDKILRAYLDALGFELNPRILWDAVPFTFVIDWFFGVGSWLDNFKVDTLELPIEYIDSYLQYSESKKVASYVGMYYTNPSPFVAGSVWPPWTTTEKFFQRMPIFPDYATLAGLGWRTPTLGQASLLVSLATVLKK